MLKNQEVFNRNISG